MALEQLNDEPWPAEGRTLAEIIERLIGAELWAHLLNWNNRPHRDPYARYICIARDVRVWGTYYDEPCQTAIGASLPLLERWDAGAFIAKARIGGPFEPLTEIPSPGTGYTLTIASVRNSLLVDPSTLWVPAPGMPGVMLAPNPKLLYDVRLWLTKPASSPEAAPQTTPIRSNKDWFEWAAKNIPPDDRKHGWKKRYAKKLEDRMKVDAPGNSNIKPLSRQSIYSRLTELGWPELHDENTTI